MSQPSEIPTRHVEGTSRGSVDFVFVFKVRWREVTGWDWPWGRVGERVRDRVRVWLGWWGEVRGVLWSTGVRIKTSG